jgi:hypothetical protein
VDIIANLQAAPYLPFSYPPSQLLQAANVPSDKIGLIAIVGATEASKSILTTFCRVFVAWHEKLVMVDSLGEARTLVVRLRQERLAQV